MFLNKTSRKKISQLPNYLRALTARPISQTLLKISESANLMTMMRKKIQLITTQLLPSIFNIPKKKVLHQSDSQTKDTVFNRNEKYLNHFGIKNILTGLGAVPRCTCKRK